MKIRNFTGHPVILKTASGELLPLPSESMPLRVCFTKHSTNDCIAGVKVQEQRVSEIPGLPPPSEDAYLLVSAPVLSGGLAQGRNDLICAGTWVEDRGGIRIITTVMDTWQ